MPSRLRSLLLLCSLLASVKANAAPAAAPAAASGPRRALVLLIPEDKGAYGPTARFSEYLETAVGKNPAYLLRESTKIMGDTTPQEALDARQKVAAALNDGRKKLTAGQVEDAETSLRAAIKEVDAAAAAMEKCGELCDALALLSSVQLMKGDEPGARETLKQVLAIDKSYRFEGTSFGQNYQIILKDVRRAMSHEGILGNISTYSTPPGARVFLDGVQRGYTPTIIEHVAAGKHLIRFERAGSITSGQLIDVNGTADAVAKATLSPTPEFQSLEALLDKIAGDVRKGEPGADTLRLGAKLKVDRALVGTVSTTGESRVLLDCFLVDFGTKKKLSRLNRAFDGDEFGQLEREVQKFGNLLMAEGENRVDPKKKPSKDPLDDRTGMEDWGEEQRGGDEPKSSNPRQGNKGGSDGE